MPNAADEILKCRNLPALREGMDLPFSVLRFGVVTLVEQPASEMSELPSGIARQQDLLPFSLGSRYPREPDRPHWRGFRELGYRRLGLIRIPEVP
jgi:hypothetical protein